MLEDQNLVGIFSKRDVFGECACPGAKRGQHIGVANHDAEQRFIGIDVSLAAALDVMVAGKRRHLPVFESGSIVGMLSMRDIPTQYRRRHERYNEYLAPRA